MMRKLFLLGTGAFWLAVLGIWLVVRSGGEAASTPTITETQPAYSLAEVARHATPADCWMAIDGSIYALDAYLPDHPAREGTLEPWCGREASEAYRTKLRGRAHSPAADRLLAGYRVGRLTPE